MSRKILIMCFFSLIIGCQTNSNDIKWKKFDQSNLINESKENPNKRLQYKFIQPLFNKKNTWFEGFEVVLRDFDERNYERLKPFIIERSIPEIQQNILSGNLTYELLTKFFLYRIRKIEFDNNKFLNSIISINQNIIKEAREKDRKKPKSIYSLHGIPILLKDNINFSNLPTTAGALAFKKNYADDAHVVKNLKASGALIIGKTNLSEWAYYFCSGCPLGYSAIGGQTLNPYGRKVFESGGSSSGSGVAIASNFAPVALGTETSGSILSPSSLNSIVGMKPTVGSISRSGIIPISSTFDTSGPMTKNIIDNVIVFNASLGFDPKDPMSKNKIDVNINEILKANLDGKKFAVFKNLLDEKLYKESINKIVENGGEIIEFEPPKVDFSGFGKILDYDMKFDLNKYIENYIDTKLKINNVNDIIDFNLQDTIFRSPYGMKRFLGMSKNKISKSEYLNLKNKLRKNAQMFFFNSLKNGSVDAILSINNYHASFAAAANYPCLTVPMGYKDNGEPQNITFISSSHNEHLLYEIGYAFEKITKKRIPPSL